MIEASSEIVELLEAGNAAAFSVVLWAGGFFDDGDAEAASEFLSGVDEGDVFMLHDKADGSTGLATSEAFKTLPGRVDGERRSVLVVERAIGFKKRTSALERKVRSYDIDDISRSDNHLNCFFRYAAHGRNGECLK